MTVNDNGTVTISCYCGWTVDRPTMDAADAAGRAHIDEYEESEQLYREDPAAWAACHG
ncbi:hypothetical protein M8542_36210 [Amycolatopsis sp. OK19-0408]|uniref:Uncharacterized protein n=1 Tax=Amycolatopsis iheyensis TaxID=2945988 RepID=A0A9X2SN31_9PSEU|nr:hypothetical protein [Amycolatopsis iheyensis]MCR6488289.1 hypothetical protein [Amycolatopsis iheyensis]